MYVVVRKDITMLSLNYSEGFLYDVYTSKQIEDASYSFVTNQHRHLVTKFKTSLLARDAIDYFKLQNCAIVFFESSLGRDL